MAERADLPDDPRQLDVFPTSLDLRREDPSRNMRRFYRMTLQPDLFGGVSLVREWGRLGSGGRTVAECHCDEGRAVTALMEHAAAKRRRGYVAG
ncbi:WGR domain-containing protein [Pseudooceanicola aestuarii]|uniref:WGR domain-containing protein n=1 Tax=Pseudooceanicola aestuarii TaxID=2697319 RepID=UPI0013D374BE|nr:WGR domain-containing protein [Pseudooceanicola aestuarii]